MVLQGLREPPLRKREPLQCLSQLRRLSPLSRWTGCRCAGGRGAGWRRRSQETLLQGVGLLLQLLLLLGRPAAAAASASLLLQELSLAPLLRGRGMLPPLLLPRLLPRLILLLPQLLPKPGRVVQGVGLRLQLLPLLRQPSTVAVFACACAAAGAAAGVAFVRPRRLPLAPLLRGRRVLPLLLLLRPLLLLLPLQLLPMCRAPVASATRATTTRVLLLPLLRRRPLQRVSLLSRRRRWTGCR